MTQSPIEKAKEALRFYAYPEQHKLKGRWERDYPGGITYEVGKRVYLDNGEIAREALKALESE